MADELPSRLGRIEGLLEGIDKRMSHAEASRHEMRSALTALALQMQPLVTLTASVQSIEKRVAELENRETRRTWFGLGLAMAGGGGGGFGIAKLLDLWGHNGP